MAPKRKVPSPSQNKMTANNATPTTKKRKVNSIYDLIKNVQELSPESKRLLIHSLQGHTSNSWNQLQKRASNNRNTANSLRQVQSRQNNLQRQQNNLKSRHAALNARCNGLNAKDAAMCLRVNALENSAQELRKVIKGPVDSKTLTELAVLRQKAVQDLSKRKPGLVGAVVAIVSGTQHVHAFIRAVLALGVTLLQLLHLLGLEEIVKGVVQHAGLAGYILTGLAAAGILKGSWNGLNLHRKTERQAFTASPRTQKLLSEARQEINRNKLANPNPNPKP